MNTLLSAKVITVSLLQKRQPCICESFCNLLTILKRERFSWKNARTLKIQLTSNTIKNRTLSIKSDQATDAQSFKVSI